MGQPGFEFVLYVVVLGHSGLAPKSNNKYRVAFLFVKGFTRLLLKLFRLLDPVVRKFISPLNLRI